MTYSRQEILYRIKATLPSRWFGENTPILDSILGSLSAGWVGLFELLDYATAQTRIGTAFGAWLDLTAYDYFGYRLRRRARETDVSFRRRICKELNRDRCTRVSLLTLLRDVTGTTPDIFEPANPGDTGCYGSLAHVGVGSAGYNSAGAWGNLNLPFQVFVRTSRPVSAGIAMVNGWGGSIGGFGIGLSAYMDPGANSSQLTDAELYSEVCRVSPAGTVVWVSIDR
jgi:hypothetical protein